MGMGMELEMEHGSIFVPQRKRSAIRRERNSKKMMRILSINSELPPEILLVIFSKLPIANLPFCRAVCGAWNRLLLTFPSSSKLFSNTFFVFTKFPSTHPSNLTMYSMDFKPRRIKFFAFFRLHPDWSSFTIATTCKGLLCVVKNMTSTAILNPMTNEFFHLPGSENPYRKSSPLSDDRKWFFYGFGFDPAANQYKLVRVCTPIRTEKTSSFDIFTFASGITSGQDWTHIGSTSFRIHTHGVYFNGALYWLGSNQQSNSVVYRFDLRHHNFAAVYVSEYCMEIGAFDGGVYGTVCTSYEGGGKFEVWMMRGENDSWVREFVVDSIPQLWFVKSSRAGLHLIQGCHDGQILCLIHGLYLVLYNPTTGKIRKVNRVGRGKSRMILLAHQIHTLKFQSLQAIFAGHY